ncbi:photosynthetic complex putative assembly protein PuhB [Methylobacterium sp. CM6257]
MRPGHRRARVDGTGEPRPVGFRLEPGERMLWQGHPEMPALRRHLLKVRWLAAYFAGLLAWKLVLIACVRGAQPPEVFDAAALLVQGTVLMGIVTYFAWVLARSTTYTLTDLRLVICHGIALPATVDIPLRAVRSVAVRIRTDGTGGVALAVQDGAGIGYSKLWPHVQGLSLSCPVPMLRGLRDAAVLSTRLARQLDTKLPLPIHQDPGAGDGSLDTGGRTRNDGSIRGCADRAVPSSGRGSLDRLW